MRNKSEQVKSELKRVESEPNQVKNGFENIENDLE